MRSRKQAMQRVSLVCERLYPGTQGNSSSPKKQEAATFSRKTCRQSLNDTSQKDYNDWVNYSCSAAEIQEAASHEFAVRMQKAKQQTQSTVTPLHSK